MLLTQILTVDRILARMEASDKYEAIRQLVQAVCRSGTCSDEQKLLQAVLDREAIRTTGIGRGLAVPHGKSDCCEELVMSLARPVSPIDFESQDHLPVDVIVLLASPANKTGPHIQALARISRLMLLADFRKAIAQADSAEAIYEVIKRAEE